MRYRRIIAPLENTSKDWSSLSPETRPGQHDISSQCAESYFVISISERRSQTLDRSLPKDRYSIVIGCPVLAYWFEVGDID